MRNMNRRNFVRTGVVACGAALTGLAETRAYTMTTPASFSLRYAPHFGMFRHQAGDDLVAQLEYAAEQGFRAWEDNEMRSRPVEDQERITQAMARLGMQMGVFVAHTIPWGEPKLTSGNTEHRAAFLQEIEGSVAVAKRVNATWMTVVPGHLDLRQDVGYQTANLVESLRRAADLLEPHELVMVLEPLNPRDHPGLMLTKAAQAYEICRAVDSPACKILFDIYHQQITEGNLIPNIARAWDEIAYFQIGDNPGRNEPTTGEINYANVFKYIHDRGFEGILGMEHGNAKEGAAGEQAIIEAYTQVDPS